MGKPGASPPTPEQRAALIEAARNGQPFVGCAQRIGKSLRWLSAARQADESLDEAMLLAMSDYEAGLIASRADALTMGNAPLANALTKILAQRFPQRHSEDARIRYSIETAAEERLEDLPTTRVQDAGNILGIDQGQLREYMAKRLREMDGE